MKSKLFDMEVWSNIDYSNYYNKLFERLIDWLISNSNNMRELEYQSIDFKETD